MAIETKNKKRGTADWFVQGALARIGDTLDRVTGRGAKPASSIATSGLIERLKNLVDAELREDDKGRKFAPHNIKLKIQWDKFATDSGDGIDKLRAQLLTGLIDHINDRRYYTSAPISLDVKNDYFTDGVKLVASFDGDEDAEERELNVTLPNAVIPQMIPQTPAGAAALSPAVAGPAQAANEIVASLELTFSQQGRPFTRKYQLAPGKRLSVGRSKHNDVVIDDASVSKTHASLLFDGSGRLRVADTGSTNGTFVKGERIAYGKAVEITPGERLGFGSVEVSVKMDTRIVEAPPPEPAVAATEAATEAFEKIGDFGFHTRRPDPAAPQIIPNTTPDVEIGDVTVPIDLNSSAGSTDGKDPE